MIAAIILGIHVLAGGYAFWTRKKDGWAEAFMAVAFVGIIFSVGWTIMTMVTGLLLEPQGLAEWMNRDTVTLLLLTAAEGIFYYYFLRKEPGDAPKS